MTSFSDLGLKPELLNALDDLEFSTPTPIQLKAIPVLLNGITDFIGLAQTGTGKTAAYGLPILQLLDENKNYPQALIVCPTRELCMQINQDLASLKKYTSIKTIPVYGGTSIVNQINSIKRGVQIVVATPGRLIDLIERKTINLNQVKYVVLDEADEMLNMGFREDIHFILENSPHRESVWLFSATMPEDVRQIANRFMTSPKEVTIGKKNTTNANIDHYYFVMPANRRFEALKRILDFNPDMYGIIFTRTKAGAQEIAEKLSRSHYSIEALHGDLSQQQRDKVMRSFRNKSIKLLAATDVAARGLDVDSITHVINFELPDDPEVYTHRSGRTGRAGKTGLCFSLCHSRELYRITEIQKLIKTPIQKADIPSGEEIGKKLFHNFIESFLTTQPVPLPEGLIEDALKELESVSKKDLIERIASLELKNTLEYYQDAEDLNIKKDFTERKGERNSRFSDSGDFQKLFINLGSKDGFHKASFLQFIMKEGGLSKPEIGQINLKDVHSYLEVKKNTTKKIIGRLNRKKYRGRTLRINKA